MPQFTPAGASLYQCTVWNKLLPSCTKKKILPPLQQSRLRAHLRSQTMPASPTRHSWKRCARARPGFFANVTILRSARKVVGRFEPCESPPSALSKSGHLLGGHESIKVIKVWAMFSKNNSFNDGVVMEDARMHKHPHKDISTQIHAFLCLCRCVTSLPISLIICASFWARWFLWQHCYPQSQEKGFRSLSWFHWSVAIVTGNASGRAQRTRTVIALLEHGSRLEEN